MYEYVYFYILFLINATLGKLCLSSMVSLFSERKEVAWPSEISISYRACCGGDDVGGRGGGFPQALSWSVAIFLSHKPNY